MNSPPIGFDLYSKGKDGIWKSFREAKQHTQTSKQQQTTTKLTKLRPEVHLFLFLFFNFISRRSSIWVDYFISLSEFLSLPIFRFPHQSPVPQGGTHMDTHTHTHITVDVTGLTLIKSLKRSSYIEPHGITDSWSLFKSTPRPTVHLFSVGNLLSI